MGEGDVWGDIYFECEGKVWFMLHVEHSHPNLIKRNAGLRNGSPGVPPMPLPFVRPWIQDCPG